MDERSRQNGGQRHDADWPRTMASELRQGVRHIDRGLSGRATVAFFAPPFAPVTMRRVVRRHGRGRRRPFSLLPLVLGIALLLMFLSGSPRVIFLVIPLLFFLLPVYFIARLFSWTTRAADVDIEEELGYEEPDERVAAAAFDEREVRLQSTCDRLLAALEDAPDSVHAFLSRPRRTIEALRRTALDLLRRERQLRALAGDEDQARLLHERARLLKRIENETDTVARARLESALEMLDTQRAERDRIVRSANRLDAELTRLTYTLESLLTQVQRVKSAGVAQEPGAADSLRKSVEGLRDEMSALADALEDVDEDAAAQAAAQRRPPVRPDVHV